MSPNVTSVLAVAETLTVAERQELIDCLLESLPDSDAETPTLSEAWLQEIAHRSAEYDAGLVLGVPWEVIQARWAARRAAGG